MNGKARDFYEVRAILNEKTRHSNKRASANPVKLHANVTSYSENPAAKYANKYTQNMGLATAVSKNVRKNTILL